MCLIYIKYFFLAHPFLELLVQPGDDALLIEQVEVGQALAGGQLRGLQLRQCPTSGVDVQSVDQLVLFLKSKDGTIFIQQGLMDER